MSRTRLLDGERRRGSSPGPENRLAVRRGTGTLGRAAERYAVDDEEWATGIRCIAMSDFDRNDMPSFALSTSVPVQRKADKVMKEMLKNLQPIADELSSGLRAERS